MNSVFNDVPAKSVEALVEFIQADEKGSVRDCKMLQEGLHDSKRGDNEHIMSGQSWPYCKSYTCYI